jgi:hypothetical protein
MDNPLSADLRVIDSAVSYEAVERLPHPPTPLTVQLLEGGRLTQAASSTS